MVELKQKTKRMRAIHQYRKMRTRLRSIVRKTAEKTVAVKNGWTSKVKLKVANWKGVIPSYSEELSDGQKQLHANVTTLEKKPADLFDKCLKFTAAKELIAVGLYPYFRAIESGQDIEVMVKGKKMIMIGSNNYLGLTNDPRVKEASIKAVEKYGSGCTGSRFLNGTLVLHEELEEKLAKFMNKEAALVFSTGFQTNLGVISALVDKNDIILSDRSNHASIVDGCRLSFGKTIKYRHNDMKDLERLLEKTQNADGRLIVIDGVFSMEGELAPLSEIAKLAKRHKARVMVDDAHAVGIFGRHGRGTPEHFNVEDDIDLIMYTFSKSFASIGGVVAGPENVIHYMKHFSRELIFSASLPPAAVATVLKALEIIEKEPERRTHLWEITKRMMKEYKSLGFNIGATESPIIPIYIGDDKITFTFAKMLADEGIFANPIVSPAVPPGMALIRTSYTATHTHEEMDFVLEKFKKVGKALNII